MRSKSRWAQGAQRDSRQGIRIADDYQGRRDRREGDRSEGPPREHGCADGARGREQDIRSCRRRHDDRDRARAGHFSRRGQARRQRRQSDGHQARHRSRRRRRDRRAEEDGEAGERQHGGAGRHHLGQQRRADRQGHRRGDGKGRQRRGHHRRRGTDHRHLARDRRGDAVRPRIPVALLRDRSRADGSGARQPAPAHLRKEAVRAEGSAARAGKSREERVVAADHCRRRGKRSAGHARREQAARHLAGGRGESARLRRSPEGDARRHRHPDRRAGDHRRPRHQAREPHHRRSWRGQEGDDRQGHTRPSSRAPATGKPSKGASSSFGRRSRTSPPITIARNCRSGSRSSSAAWR